MITNHYVVILIIMLQYNLLRLEDYDGIRVLAEASVADSASSEKITKFTGSVKSYNPEVWLWRTFSLG